MAAHADESLLVLPLSLDDGRQSKRPTLLVRISLNCYKDKVFNQLQRGGGLRLCINNFKWITI